MKIDLPGGEWADIRDLDSLTGADQDAYGDEVDRLLEIRRSEAEAAARAANPAMMPDPADTPRGRLTGADTRTLRDVLLGKLISDWSYSDRLPLPYVAAYRGRLPLVACVKLTEAIDPLVDVLNGNIPKETETPTGSAGTSPEATSNLQPEPQPAP